MPKIGFLDSGVGGLSILQEAHQLLPNCDTLYFADQGNVPYGPRPHHEIDRFVDPIVRFLHAEGAETIVLACHAASAASLYNLRERYPQIAFVGLEPALKPALTQTQSGVVGVLTTQATADGQLYQQLLARYAHNTRVITQVTPQLVALVEAGQLDGEPARSVVASYLAPLLAAGVDQIVLACTHFPFLAPLIRQIIGDGVTLVEPSEPVARQVSRVSEPCPPQIPTHRYFTSGNVASFDAIASLLMKQPIRADFIANEH